jgi:hypothetical protein
VHHVAAQTVTPGEGVDVGVVADPWCWRRRG